VAISLNSATGFTMLSCGLRRHNSCPCASFSTANCSRSRSRVTRESASPAMGHRRVRNEPKYRRNDCERYRQRLDPLHKGFNPCFREERKFLLDLPPAENGADLVQYFRAHSQFQLSRRVPTAQRRASCGIRPLAGRSCKRRHSGGDREKAASYFYFCRSIRA